MKSWLWLSIAVLLLCSTAARGARAQDEVAALGVRTLDGDVELERKLSAALRNGARAVERWVVGDRELTLAQMSLAHGCDEPDSGCLRDIAQTLAVDRLLYGTVIEDRRGNQELTLYSFETSTGRVRSVVGQLPKESRKSTEEDAAIVATLVRQLSGERSTAPAPQTGHLRVVGKQAGASIYINGVSQGALDESRVLNLDLAPGKYFVLATGPTPGASEEHLALISAGGTVVVELAQQEPGAAAPAPDLSVTEADEPPPVARAPRRSLKRILGWASVGLSAAFALATVYTWVRIERINDDRDYLAYRAVYPRARAPGGVSDVCREAERGTLAMRDPSRAGLERTARGLCDEADTLGTLQYVFLGGALAAAGAGTYLLLKANREPPTSVRIAPRFGANAGLLEASVRF